MEKILTNYNMKNYTDTLKKCLKIANSRQKQYGSAKDSMTLTREILDTTFGIKLTEKEICHVIISIKLARQKYKQKEDSVIDIINYLAISLL